MTITLFRTDQGWMAKYTGKGSERVTELFGRNTLPTAFTAQAKASVVLSHVQTLNPEADVWLDRDSDTARTSERGSTLTPVIAVITLVTMSVLLLVGSGLLQAVMHKLAEVR